MLNEHTCWCKLLEEHPIIQTETPELYAEMRQEDIKHHAVKDVMAQMWPKKTEEELIAWFADEDRNSSVCICGEIEPFVQSLITFLEEQHE